MVLKKKSKRLEHVFLGKLIKKGNRARAEKVLFRCLNGLVPQENNASVEKSNLKYSKIFEESVEAITPLIDLKSKKVSGTFYRIPIYIERRKAMSKGINLLLEILSARKGVPMEVKLKEELLLARSGQGKTVGRLQELYESGKKNRGLVKFL